MRRPCAPRAVTEPLGVTVEVGSAAATVPAPMESAPTAAASPSKFTMKTNGASSLYATGTATPEAVRSKTCRR